MSARGDSTTAELRKIKLIDWAILCALGVCGSIALQMNNRLIELNTTVTSQVVQINKLDEKLDGLGTLRERVTSLETRVSANERRIEAHEGAVARGMK